MQHYINNVPVSEEDYSDYISKKKKKRKIVILTTSIIIIGITLFSAAIVFGITAILENSDAYKVAKETIHNNDEVLRATDGIKKMNLEQGKIETNSFGGDAEFNIGVKGIEKDVNVYIHLEYSGMGSWKTEEIHIGQ